MLVNDTFMHIPVLLKECVEALKITDGGIYFDGTFGGGGHAKAILDSANCTVIATDKDHYAISNANLKFKNYSTRLQLIQSDFCNFSTIMESLGFTSIDGALLDLGVSSYQIDTPSRGFSYINEGILDMRMDNSSGISAIDIVNSYKQEEISQILSDYGEEKFANRIAKNIVIARQHKPITTTLQLSDIIRKSVPYIKNAGHPSKKTFMALRIAVNNELGIIENTIADIVTNLKPKARLCIITFHSLEDRIVKKKFHEFASGCICDKRLPICVCNHKSVIKVFKKIVPTQQELLFNKRSKSAILRTIEKK